MSARSALASVILALLAGLALSPSIGLAAAPADGKTLFLANCATCHGADGKGTNTKVELGFDLPLPDFTDCTFAQREADGDWLSILHRGGQVRAFSRNMPAFDQALTEAEFDAVLGYVRSFCAGSPWPRGEFNLPLAMFTEKAFPEDELVAYLSAAVDGPTEVTTNVVYEKRFGPRGQLEVNVPFSVVESPAGRTERGIGDLALAWKQNLLANVGTGTIFSVLGEAVLPTGSEKRGLGGGSAVFEGHALFGQLLPHEFFFQSDLLAEFPTKKGLPDEAQGRFALGRTFGEDEGWGRAWSPQLELIAAHEFEKGAGVDWDIVPQLQVSLSRRQHILFSAGARIPLNDTANRKPTAMFYLIWDWFDAGFFDGWRPP